MTDGIGESAQSQLRRSPFFALRDVRCVSRDGVLTLHGRLPSHYLKQIAQTIVADIEGVTTVNNQIEVTSSMRCGAVDRSEGLRWRF